jgi:hypothetical protein
LSNRKLAALIFVALLLLGWIIANPPGRFGWCRFGLTVYNCVPRPISDLQIRSDGKLRTVAKTHDLTLEAVQWLLEPKPEFLVIAIGWDGVTQPAPEIAALQQCQVKILKSGEALKLFNQLKKAGKSVAIHYHSTC